MLRTLEWNDPKAKYPNLWSGGLPSTVLVFDTIARRLRIGDLIAVYHPASVRHPDRAERFVGLVRVDGLRRAPARGQYWLDLDPAHRFRRPLDLGRAPRRVFLCCDADWPGPDRELFLEVHAAAVAEGWTPAPDEVAPPPPPRSAPVAESSGSADSAPVAVAEVVAEETVVPPPQEDEPVVGAPVAPAPDEATRQFAGLSWSGDRRDPRDGTWLAIVGLDRDGRARVRRLEAVGRHGAQAYLRDTDRALLRVEATGCAFPFGQPEGFVERLAGGRYPTDGWWGLARAFESVGYARFLVHVQEFRDSAGDARRLTDDRADLVSSLARDHGDRASKSFHGIRTIAEDRSRYAIRPFETAQARLLIEVDPTAAARDLVLPEGAKDDPGGWLVALARADAFPIDVDEPARGRCLGSRAAFEAVLAARAAARAVLTGETDRSPEELAPDAPERVLREGWVYGVPR